MKGSFSFPERPNLRRALGDRTIRIERLERRHQVVSSGGAGLLDTILSKNPYLFYKLNETSGSIAHDSSGNGLDLNAGSYAAPAWGQTAGPPGEVCALFTAADTQRLANPSIPDVSGGGADDFTVIAWFKYIGLPSVIVGQGQPGRSFGSGWQLGVGGDGFDTQLLFLMHNDSINGGYWVNGDNPLTSGDWYMGAAVQSGGSQYLYLNGLQQTMVGSNAYTGNGGLWIGNDGHGDDVEAANGDVSYLMIIKHALSGAEILAIYNSGFPNADDGEVFTADGDGGTKFRKLVVSAPLTLTVTGDELELGDTGGSGATPDGVTLDTNGSGELEVKAGGVDTTQLADAGPGATGPIGDATHTPVVTIDAKGRVTGLTSAPIAGGGSGAAPDGVTLDLDGSGDLEIKPNAVTPAQLQPDPTGNDGKWVRLSSGAFVYANPTAADVGAVPTARQILAGTGLSGGGDLTADRTLSLPNVGPGVTTVGDATHVAQVTTDVQGRITALSAVAISGGGGGSSMDDVLWQKTFWSDEGLLPATQYIDRLDDFGSFDFENSGATLTKYKSSWTVAGKTTTAHYAFDTGAARSKILMLFGLAAWSAGNANSAFGIYFSNASSNADGEIPGNCYVLTNNATGSATTFWNASTWYKVAAGTFTSLGAVSVANPGAGLAGSIAFLFDGVAGTISLWTRYAGTGWHRLATVSDATYSTMRQCGLRLYSAGTAQTAFLTTPAVVYYTT